MTDELYKRQNKNLKYNLANFKIHSVHQVLLTKPFVRHVCYEHKHVVRVYKIRVGIYIVLGYFACILILCNNLCQPLRIATRFLKDTHNLEDLKKAQLLFSIQR